MTKKNMLIRQVCNQLLTAIWIVLGSFSLWSCNRMDTRMGHHTASKSSNAGKHIQTADEIELESFDPAASTRPIAYDLDEELGFARDISAIIEQLLSIKRSYVAAYSKGKAIINGLTTFCVGTVSVGMFGYLVYLRSSSYSDCDFSFDGCNSSLSLNEMEQLTRRNLDHLNYALWRNLTRVPRTVEVKLDINQFINEHIFRPKVYQCCSGLVSYLNTERILKVLGSVVIGGIAVGMTQKIQHLVRTFYNVIIKKQPRLIGVKCFSDNELRICKQETLCALKTLGSDNKAILKSVRIDLRELFLQAVKLVHYIIYNTGELERMALAGTLDKWNMLLAKLSKEIDDYENINVESSSDRLEILKHCKNTMACGIYFIEKHCLVSPEV